jgi:hypothetical protein
VLSVIKRREPTHEGHWQRSFNRSCHLIEILLPDPRSGLLESLHRCLGHSRSLCLILDIDRGFKICELELDRGGEKPGCSLLPLLHLVDELLSSHGCLSG